jgi:hypothetical protein
MLDLEMNWKNQALETTTFHPEIVAKPDEEWYINNKQQITAEDTCLNIDFPFVLSSWRFTGVINRHKIAQEV